MITPSNGFRPRNRRVERARSRSPLVRSPSPFVRAIALAAVILAGTACGFEHEWSGISVNAPEEWVGATVAIDGREAGKLEYLMLHDSAAEKFLKKQQGDSLAFHVVALNVALDSGKFPRGLHKVRVEKAGRGVVEGEFTYPDPRGSTVQFLSINGGTLENTAGPDAHGSHP